jgi:hypothetical protein
MNTRIWSIGRPIRCTVAMDTTVIAPTRLENVMVKDIMCDPKCVRQENW